MNVLIKEENWVRYAKSDKFRNQRNAIENRFFDAKIAHFTISFNFEIEIVELTFVATNTTECSRQLLMKDK